MTITRVSDSTVILTRPETIWKTIRNFKNIDRWHPDVRNSVIEDGGPGDRVGAVRRIQLQNGMSVREQVTAISDKDMSYSYSVIESPLGLLHHSSTVSLIPIDGGSKTLVTWYADFTPKQGDPGPVAAAIQQGVILLGFQGLAKLAAEADQLTHAAT